MVAGSCARILVSFVKKGEILVGVRILGDHISLAGIKFESCDVDWEILLSQRVPRLDKTCQIGNADCEIQRLVSSGDLGQYLHLKSGLEWLNV